MKAKDYKVIYQNDSSPEALAKIALMFIDEISEIAKTRKCSTDESVFSILDELERKWKAFSRIAKVGTAGFRATLQLVMPEVYEDWIKSKVK